MKRTLVLILTFCLSSSLLAQNSINIFLKADSLVSVEKREEAKEYLIQLTNKNPYNCNFFYDLGIIYYDKGEYKKSISQFRKAQALGLYDHSNYYLSGSYMKINRPDSALYYLKKHVVTPMNDNFFDEEALYDTIFQGLHNMPEYIKLLPPKIVDSLAIAKNWITDISYLSKMLKKTHYDPFFKIDEREWDKQIEQLKADIPSLNNNQILVRINQFLNLMGDAHTARRESEDNQSIFPNNRLPIYLKIFSDGCYITEATDEYKELLGGKIIKVNQFDYDTVFEKVSSMISRDNEIWPKFFFPWFFNHMNYLHGLGISNSTDNLEITYLLNNEIKSKHINSVKEMFFPKMTDYHIAKETTAPMFYKNRFRAYWYKYLEEDNILYAQINTITSLPDNPLEKFCDSIKTFVDTHNISAFVLDIRNNTGGNSDLNPTIVKLMLSEKINVKGKSFTVIDYTTFSAAQNLAADIEVYTETIFIGEPTGSRPNFIGEVNPFKLPYSGLVISSSNLYHQHGLYSSDTRTWIAPDIYIDFSFGDFKNGIDPVLEKIIEFKKK